MVKATRIKLLLTDEPAAAHAVVSDQVATGTTADFALPQGPAR